MVHQLHAVTTLKEILMILPNLKYCADEDPRRSMMKNFLQQGSSLTVDDLDCGVLQLRALAVHLLASRRLRNSSEEFSPVATGFSSTSSVAVWSELSPRGSVVAV